MSQEREKNERERERGCGESAFCIKEIEEIRRQPEAVQSSRHTHEYTSQTEMYSCVSHGVRKTTYNSGCVTYTGKKSFPVFFILYFLYLIYNFSNKIIFARQSSPHNQELHGLSKNSSLSYFPF